MRHPTGNPRGIPRLTAVAILVAAILGSLVATFVPTPTPAGAVPVDGLYIGTITNTFPTPLADNPSLNSSSNLEVRLTTTPGSRADVTASITIVAPPAAPNPLTVECSGSHPVNAPPSAPISFTTSGGGIASSAARIDASLSKTVMPPVSQVQMDVTATVSADRRELTGKVIVHLPNGFPANCKNATLSFTAFAARPHTIRTGHDGGPDVMVGNPPMPVDISHMIDREAATVMAPWRRCMFLWADPAAGTTATVSTATWSVDPGGPQGATIEPGFEHGVPLGLPDGPTDPLRTRVCITDDTPVDRTFTVRFTPNSPTLPSRVVLWTRDNVNYPGRAQGDVHHVTFDETRYDFQGVGEYVDAVAGDGADFAVQSRLETVPSAPVSVTTAIAARVNGDRVGLYLDPSGTPQWYLDGRPLAIPAKLPSGGEITNPTPDHWRVNWPTTGKGWGSTDGTTMQVSFARWTPKDHFNIDELLLGQGLLGGQVSGLLGIADRDGTNDLTPSYGGDPVSPAIDPSLPAFEQPLYKEFGRSWLVAAKGPNESLFDYLDPGHPDSTSYEHESFPAERPGVVDRRARAVCEKAGVTAQPQLDFCTYDIEVTGAREIASYYRDGWLPV